MKVNNWSVSVVTPAVTRAVTTDEAKKQLELIGTSHHDAMLDALIIAAEERFRQEVNFQFGSQTEQLHLIAFPDDQEILLPVFPVQSVDSISYTDADDNVVTIDAGDYDSLVNFTPARIYPADSWPSDTGRGTIDVTYTTGFATAAEFPSAAKQAILVLVAIMFAERAGTPPSKLMYRHGDLSALYVALRDGFKYGDDFLTFSP